MEFFGLKLWETELCFDSAGEGSGAKFPKEGSGGSGGKAGASDMDTMLVEERARGSEGTRFKEPKLLELLIGPEGEGKDCIEELGEIGEVGEEPRRRSA